jgi:hypothetical protein
MFLLDSLLIDGIKFVLDKVAVAAESAMDDESQLREQLVDAQLKLESGEISEEEYAERERDILPALSAARRRRMGEIESTADYKVTGADVDVQFTDDEDKR